MTSFHPERLLSTCRDAPRRVRIRPGIIKSRRLRGLRRDHPAGICVISFNLWNPMSAANPICEICGICESQRSAATPNPGGCRPDGLCVIRVICETLLHNICEKSAYLRNLRETFFRQRREGADAPRRVPTLGEIGRKPGKLGSLRGLGKLGGLGGMGIMGERDILRNRILRNRGNRGGGNGDRPGAGGLRGGRYWGSGG